MNSEQSRQSLKKHTGTEYVAIRSLHKSRVRTKNLQEISMLLSCQQHSGPHQIMRLLYALVIHWSYALLGNNCSVTTMATCQVGESVVQVGEWYLNAHQDTDVKPSATVNIALSKSFDNTCCCCLCILVALQPHKQGISAHTNSLSTGTSHPD